MRPADEATPYEAFDHLGTMVAVLHQDGKCAFVNAAFETTLGLSRRNVLRESAWEWFDHPEVARENIAVVAANRFATSRFEALLRPRPGIHPGEALPVLAIVSAIERPGQSRSVLLELLQIEQQTRQDRENRYLEQAQTNKELIRNLAHEIKNPLGGIRGAAQLLEMEIAPHSPNLCEYTQVIIKEADRLQGLVDRLLAPHRKPHVVGDVNIHEVCERVRAVILAQYPTGLLVQRCYDVSIPEFRGDKEQLIQALLNVVQNAAQALTPQMTAGDARIVLHTRIARQVTVGKQRYRLALELLIEDNGPGVPAAIADRIFLPLVSGREGGSGLGLTLAQTFVQQHMGTIECESEPGWTRFKIWLPLP